MAFRFQQLRLPGVALIEPDIYHDDRGLFLESYKTSTFSDAGISADFVQDNFSQSKYGVLRGLHYQLPPRAQAKLVSVIRGEIFDVAVDIRRGSPTFGQWVGETLSDANRRMLYVPEGFAHGFCVLSNQADVLYKVTAEYSLQHDRGIIWNDFKIGISWPITTPTISPKDAKLPSLEECENTFVFEN